LHANGSYLPDAAPQETVSIDTPRLKILENALPYTPYVDVILYHRSHVHWIWQVWQQKHCNYTRAHLQTRSHKTFASYMCMQLDYCYLRTV